MDSTIYLSYNLPQKICQLRKAIFSIVHNILQPNFAILLSLGRSFNLWQYFFPISIFFKISSKKLRSNELTTFEMLGQCSTNRATRLVRVCNISKLSLHFHDCTCMDSARKYQTVKEMSSIPALVRYIFQGINS